MQRGGRGRQDAFDFRREDFRRESIFIPDEPSARQSPAGEGGLA
jgi:hypothetical protein